MITGSLREELIKSFQKYRNMILSIAFILLALAISNYIYRIQAKRAESLKAMKETELKRNGLLGQISRSEKKIQYYRGLFNKKDLPSITNVVNKLALDSGVRISSVRPNREERFAAFAKYSYLLIISADSYHAIGKFVSGIENYPDFYFFDALNIKLKNTGGPVDEVPGEMPKTGNELIADIALSIIAFEG